MFWTLHDLPQGPVPEGHSVERHLGVFDAAGQAKPAVEVLPGRRANPPPLPRLSSQDRLLKLLPFMGLAVAVLALTVLLLVPGYRLLRRRRTRRSV